MKRETKLGVFFCIVVLCLIAHFLYYGQQADLPLYRLLNLFLIGLWASIVMLYSILPPKKKRIPDYSKVFSFIGILVSLCSFVFYFSWFLGIWSNIDLAVFLLLIPNVYFLILLWYKNGWRG